jgi:hypothetical protein
MRLFTLLWAMTTASNLTLMRARRQLRARISVLRTVFFSRSDAILAGGRIDLEIRTQIGVKVVEGLRHVLAAVSEANVAGFVVHASRKQHYA